MWELPLRPQLCSSFLGPSFVFLFPTEGQFLRHKVPRHRDKVHTTSSTVQIAQTILPVASGG